MEYAIVFVPMLFQKQSIMQNSSIIIASFSPYYPIILHR